MIQELDRSKRNGHWEAFFVDGSDARRALYERYRRLRNRQSLTMRRRTASEIADQTELNIPSNLGFAYFQPGRFPEVNAIVYEANHQLAKLDPAQVIQPDVGTKGLVMGLFDSSRVNLDSPTLKLALRPEILGMVTQYLGIVPVLARIDLWYSAHHAELNRTHYYHCDWTATTQVKVFINCTDVDPENGPLTIVEAAKSREMRAQLKYDYDRQGNKYYVPDDTMAKLGATAHEHRFTGAAGTVYAVDTSRCFHYGSRFAPDASPRLVALIQYLKPTAFRLPVKFKKAAPFRHLAHDDLPLCERLALGAA